ncbi:hypothetical protein RHOSPDRAFT_30959 [Rhodotorula sp. JG-1b]|nr:hypothetical protein RHOSPDRAFT_30959 [Rhodotorula sp. JG-1b]
MARIIPGKTKAKIKAFKASSSSSSSHAMDTTEKKKKKSSTSGGASPSTGVRTAYQQFMSRVMAELKEQHPDWTGQERREEMSKRWKTDASNPKAET